jgi:hypothetical protein
MTALEVMLRGALQFPSISSLVPVKSKTALPTRLSMVKASLIVDPSSI